MIGYPSTAAMQATGILLRQQKHLDEAAELLRRHQQVCQFEGLHEDTEAFLVKLAQPAPKRMPFP